MAERWSNQVTHGGTCLVVEDGRLLVVSLGTGWVSFVGIPLSFALTLASIFMLVFVPLAAVGEAPWQLAVGVIIAVVTLGSAMWTLVRYTKKRQAWPQDQHVLVATIDLKARQLLNGQGQVVAHLDEVVVRKRLRLHKSGVTDLVAEWPGGSMLLVKEKSFSFGYDEMISTLKRIGVKVGEPWRRVAS